MKHLIRSIVFTAIVIVSSSRAQAEPRTVDEDIVSYSDWESAMTEAGWAEADPILSLSRGAAGWPPLCRRGL